MEKNKPKLYRVDWGIIRLDESLMSRDCGDPEFLDTSQQVNKTLRERETLC